MKIAILDLGTNTFLLLIADVYPDRSFKKIYQSKVTVKLGEGAIHKNNIAEKPFLRGQKAIERFKKICNKYRVKKIHAFATSAIRGAENGKEFIWKIKRSTGINIQIIPGSKEAELIWYGVKQCVDFGDKPCLVMDIGGGSTEFIISDKNKIYWKKSFDIGAARMLELFHPSDPVKKSEIRKVESFLDKKLIDLHKAIKKFPVDKLVGASGSFDSFAEMISYRVHGKNVIGRRTNFPINLKEYLKLHDKLLRSTVKERIRMKGLVGMRVDMIVLASICMHYVLKKFEIKEIVLSKFALKEGALFKIVQLDTYPSNGLLL